MLERAGVTGGKDGKGQYAEGPLGLDKRPAVATAIALGHRVIRKKSN